MKEWPKDNKPVDDIDKLLDPLLATFFYYYRPQRVKYSTSIEEERGTKISRSMYETPPSVKHIVETMAERFDGDFKDQMKDPIKLLLETAFQYGFEEGKRHTVDPENFMNKAKALLEKHDDKKL